MTLFYSHSPGHAGALTFPEQAVSIASPALSLHRSLVSKVPATRIEVDLDAIAKTFRC